MKKTIGCFIHSPASANNIFAIWNKLKERYDVKVYCFHPYARHLFDSVKIYTYEDLQMLFDSSYFDFILTGTGSMHPIELEIPIISHSRGIPCLSILDCFWMDDDNLLQRFQSVPDFITAPNKDVKERLVKLLNIQESRVLDIGIPHFDRLKEYIKPKHNNTSNIASFFSTCSTSDDFSDTHPKAKQAITELATWIEKSNKYEKVMVTKHPRENGIWLGDFCQRHDRFVFTDESSWDLLLKSDIVFGLSSTLLQEAKIINKASVIYENKGDFMNLRFNEYTQSISSEYISSFDSINQLYSFIKSLLS